MANKKVILSNGDGRITFTDPATISIDDTTDNLNIKHLSSSADIQINSLPSGVQLLSASAGGVIGTVPVSTTVGGALLWNGTQWSGSSTLLQQYSGSAGGDLSGTYPSPQVVSVANIDSGVLPVEHGGTSLSIAEGNRSSKVVLKVSGSVNPVISGITGSSSNSGSVLTNVEGSWKFMPPAYAPDVRFYTYDGVTNTFTWTRPSGAKFARVILQGAGGGGGGNVSGVTEGGGGGSGGYTDIIIDISNIASVTVTTGLGGNGGIDNQTVASRTGQNGGITYFGVIASAGGGGGAVAGTGGAGGAGTTRTGYSGGATGAGAPTAYGMPSGGGAGSSGGTGGLIVNMIYNGNRNFGYNTTTDGLDISTNLILARGADGALTTSSPTPNRPGYGAGGGGARSSTVQRAGPGGHGYALIISW